MFYFHGLILKEAKSCRLASVVAASFFILKKDTKKTDLLFKTLPCALK
jgi:hypothetical protein